MTTPLQFSPHWYGAICVALHAYCESHSWDELEQSLVYAHLAAELAGLVLTEVEDLTDLSDLALVLGRVTTDWQSMMGITEVEMEALGIMVPACVKYLRNPSGPGVYFDGKRPSEGFPH